MPVNILSKIIAQIQKDESVFFDAFDADTYSLHPRATPVSFDLSHADSFVTIAEVKKASPSRGTIRQSYDYLSIASEYVKAGASGISVLTEKNFFQGHKAHLQQIREITSRPLLRKDFIIHPAQIYESYNLGADIVLLIAACLKPSELQLFHGLILQLGMTPLVEIHSPEEWDQVSGLNLKLLGINNRDLKTFTVDIGTSIALMKHIPSSIPVISESGIDSEDDVKKLKDAGVKGILVGESLLRHKSPGEALRRLTLSS